MAECTDTGEELAGGARMKPFGTFSDALAYVAHNGRVFYKAPLSPVGQLPATIDADGRIKIRFDVPAGHGWPAETYYRLAFHGPDTPDNHFSRLRDPHRK